MANVPVKKLMAAQAANERSRNTKLFIKREIFT